MRPLRFSTLQVSIALLALCAACGGGGGGDDDAPAVDAADTRLHLVTPDQCNPLGGASCVTPFPSGLYMVQDAATATGWRVDIPAGALPTSIDGYPIDPAPYNTRDGFSADAHIFTAFAGGVDRSNLVHYTHYADSVTDDSPTVIVDMSTGERVVHFAEVDERADDTPDKQALYLRPAVRLHGSTRYAVGIRKSLHARGGGALPVPEGFQALLDGTITSHPLLERARPRYDDVFAALEQAGVPRDDLVVAWDFVTASDASVRADMLDARDAALPHLSGDGAITYTVTRDGPTDDARIARRIDGTFDAPLFLTNGGSFVPGTVLARDDQGKPKYSGMYRVPFTAIIPACAYEQRPVGIMLYGHGLLGQASDQVTSGAIRNTSAEICLVVAGTDWRGMSLPDLPAVARTLNNLNNGAEVFETLVQGIINFIALDYAVRGPLAELFVDDEGVSLVDPTKVYFYGLSQGHIFGSTFKAYDPLITRGTLGCGGANYSEMLERSVDWPTYRDIVIGAYPDPLDVVVIIHLVQLGWDRTDPVSTSDGFFTDPIPGTPPKQILMHMSKGDAEVPNIATEFQARTMGMKALAPSVYEPYGIPVADGPLDSALVIFDGGWEQSPGNITAEDNGAHQLTRNQPAALRQMKTFFETGEIVSTCNGACDCTIGACD